MTTKLRIGDRIVYAKSEGTAKHFPFASKGKGVVIQNNSHLGFCVILDSTTGAKWNIWSVGDEDTIGLDVQYYRNKRLNKLLDERRF
ncbi:MAG: hypothetical protein SLAVMIC_00234 [uncultured marine phage]|uniref:Uncharacterized protein n=1 Tax=uncultured marine phage TaxID=707152 RepID=A0A8D9CB84_9VIRU|nr:MAG: hypothetical protein SLAVMIC_00234 [uncultured marine phage]